jgi:DNA-directed RNA polymerase specialized sigma24 family protein
VEPDEVDTLLQAAGRGDLDAFASFYDRTAPAVFNHLHHVLGDSAAAEQATVRVYVRVWRTAPVFDPAGDVRSVLPAARMSAGPGGIRPGVSP